MADDRDLEMNASALLGYITIIQDHARRMFEYTSTIELQNSTWNTSENKQKHKYLFYFSRDFYIAI